MTAQKLDLGGRQWPARVIRRAVFDPSPTSPARRYYPQEEPDMTLTNTQVTLVAVAPAVAFLVGLIAGGKWL